MQTRTLKKTVTRIANNSLSYNNAIKEFIDGVGLAQQKENLIEERPPLLSKSHESKLPDNYLNVFLAGLAEEVATKYHFKPPAWLNDKEYFFDKATYRCSTENELRINWLRESTPIEYQKRNLFCGPILSDFLFLDSAASTSSND